jgi:hypothetical protein
MQGHSLLRIYATLARNRLEAADFHAALGYAEQGLAIEERHGRCLICGVLLYPATAMAYAKNGDVKAGRHFAQLACESATEYGSRYFFGLASQSTAMVEATDGNWQEAFAALDQAEEAFESIPQPYEIARTRLFRAYVRLQRHKPQDISVAARELSRAVPIFVKLGASASASQARSMLRQLRA